ncbi:magnetosome-associated protein MamJ-like [Daphnia carinata]|uniref:magnetosome-associated protein MamJ-like n=1 Tax=Daphnia carinata TaxID=120202 RepID=UPI00257F3C23|nr:magnetosome-associated protein MamJ-like [Daphnia carinata]
MNSPIRKLPGVKKQFPHVQPKVDCKRPAIPSAAASTAQGKPIQESHRPKLKTKSPTVTGATSFKSSPIQELVKPFRAKPVPQSHYGQPFRPVLRRKSPVSTEAPKLVEVPAAEAVEAAPSQDAVEEVADVDVAVEVPAAEVAEAASSADATNVVSDEVAEVPAVAEVVEVAPAVEVDVVIAEAVEEVVDAAQVIEDLPVAAKVVEAVDEDEVVPPVVALAAEVPVPSEVVSGAEKKKRNRKKKKAFAPYVPPAPEAPAGQVEPQVVDEAWVTQLTRKQKRNICTNSGRSAARKAQREALDPDAHI